MKATIKQPYFDGLDPSKWQHWPRRKASKDPSVWYHLRGSSRILGVSSNMAGKSPIYSGKCHIYRWLWWFLPAVNLHVEEICQPPLRKPEGDCWGSSSHAKKTCTNRWLCLFPWFTSSWFVILTLCGYWRFHSHNVCCLLWKTEEWSEASNVDFTATHG